MSGADYSVEIDSLVGILTPLEESAAAAKRVKDHKDDLVAFLKDTGSADVTSAGEGFLDAWGHGMGKLVEYADDIVTKLHETIGAYTAAEEYGVRGFTPSGENLESLPTGWLGDKLYRNQQSAAHQGLDVPDPTDNPLTDKRDEAQQGFEDWAFG